MGLSEMLGGAKRATVDPGGLMDFLTLGATGGIQRQRAGQDAEARRRQEDHEMRRREFESNLRTQRVARRTTRSAEERAVATAGRSADEHTEKMALFGEARTDRDYDRTRRGVTDKYEDDQAVFDLQAAENKAEGSKLTLEYEQRMAKLRGEVLDDTIVAGLNAQHEQEVEQVNLIKAQIEAANATRDKARGELLSTPLGKVQAEMKGIKEDYPDLYKYFLTDGSGDIPDEIIETFGKAGPRAAEAAAHQVLSEKYDTSGPWVADILKSDSEYIDESIMLDIWERQKLVQDDVGRINMRESNAGPEGKKVLAALGASKRAGRIFEPRKSGEFTLAPDKLEEQMLNPEYAAKIEAFLKNMGGLETKAPYAPSIPAGGLLNRAVGRSAPTADTPYELERRRKLNALVGGYSGP